MCRQQATMQGLVGQSNAKITGSEAAGDVKAATGDYVGGLVGYSSAAIENSEAKLPADGAAVTVEGASFVGGLVGQIAAGAIKNCAAAANVRATGDHVGGLAGMSGANSSKADGINNSSATGDVVGKDKVGGLVGHISNDNAGISTITDSYAAGTVTGGSHVGGLVGKSAAHITKSFAAGNVTGGTDGSYIGGLVGQSSLDVEASSPSDSSVKLYIEMTQSYATGDVAAGGSAKYIGGLIGGQGDGHDKVEECYASGDVRAGTGEEVGGLIGRAYSELRYSYAQGEVEGGKYVGGLIGSLEESATGRARHIVKSYARGDVTGHDTAAGLIGKVTLAYNSDKSAVLNQIQYSYAAGLVYARDTNNPTTSKDLFAFIGAFLAESADNPLSGNFFRLDIPKKECGPTATAKSGFTVPVDTFFHGGDACKSKSATTKTIDGEEVVIFNVNENSILWNLADNVIDPIDVWDQLDDSNKYPCLKNVDFGPSPSCPPPAP